MGSTERPTWLTRVAEDYFQRADEIFKDISMEEMVEIMDRSGVEKAILSIAAENPSQEVLRFAQDEPDRFVLSALRQNPPQVNDAETEWAETEWMEAAKTDLAAWRSVRRSPRGSHHDTEQ